MFANVFSVIFGKYNLVEGLEQYSKMTNTHTTEDLQIVPLDIKGCICHFTKWQMHPFISKGSKCRTKQRYRRKATYYPNRNRSFCWDQLPSKFRRFHDGSCANSDHPVQILKMK